MFGYRVFFVLSITVMLLLVIVDFSIGLRLTKQFRDWATNISIKLENYCKDLICIEGKKIIKNN